MGSEVHLRYGRSNKMLVRQPFQNVQGHYCASLGGNCQAAVRKEETLVGIGEVGKLRCTRGRQCYAITQQPNTVELIGLVAPVSHNNQHLPGVLCLEWERDNHFTGVIRWAPSFIGLAMKGP